MKRWMRVLLLVALGAAGLAPTAAAQDTAIVGLITDTTGSALPGVTVNVVHVSTGSTTSMVTDGSGRFLASGLRPGRYQVVSELQGFAKTQQDDLELLIGQRVNLTMQMPLASVNETVTVTANSALVDVTTSTLGGNIDSRQMEALPINGRNWLDLSTLAKGSRANAVTDSPLPRSGGSVQINVDGQQTTNLLIAPGQLGQPQFSRDAIGEFEFVTSRFDATQGRSMGIQVNVVTKGGTNQHAGSVSGYFRNDSLNAPDLLVNRVLPYSNQQIVYTLGGPIRRDKMHFFAYHEYEREPSTFIHTSPWSGFNWDVPNVASQHKFGGRVDHQLSPTSRLMIRGNGFHYYSLDARRIGGSLRHPTSGSDSWRDSAQAFATWTKVLSSSTVNELRGGFNDFWYRYEGLLPTAPQISLRNYTIGKSNDHPQRPGQKNYQIRNDLSLVREGKGRHELKLGGEYMFMRVRFDHSRQRDGTLTATAGPVPSNIVELFPNPDDPSTWNLAALSPITVRWTQSFAPSYLHFDNRHIFAGWFQDNWRITNNFTLNLGVRYDLFPGALAQDLLMAPFKTEEGKQEYMNFGPRTGFNYALSPRTVLRGGWGLYWGEVEANVRWSAMESLTRAIPEINNDGRPNFAADPWNIGGGGRPPTFEEAFRMRRDTSGTLTSSNLRSSYSHQVALGVQQQLGSSLSVEADFVFTGTRRERVSQNVNERYTADGVPLPFSVLANRHYPEWGNVGMTFSTGRSNYQALETAITKRFGNRWQGSATYTLSRLQDLQPCPIDVATGLPFSTCPADIGGVYGLATSDQRHRAVFNGIVELPKGLQLSGLYFYGSGERFPTTCGCGNPRDQAGGGGSNRLRADGTVVPRNNFVGAPLHRIDMRLQQRFQLGAVRIDAMIEAFNVFNHANFGAYQTAESSMQYGLPQANNNVAYRSRTGQIGFRIGF